MAVADLPRPPTFEALVAWAGAGRVIRAPVSNVAGWRLPGAQRSALTSCGVPLLDGVVDLVLFEEQPLDVGYRLAGITGDADEPDWVYAAESQTGQVSAQDVSSGQVWFVNSSINHWLRSLHLVGTWYTTSTAIQTRDQDDGRESVALAELADLLHQIRHLDPPAYGDVGDHDTHFWPAVLDRWLYRSLEHTGIARQCHARPCGSR